MKQPKPHAYFDAAYEDNHHWKAYLKRTKLIAMTKIAEQEGWVKDGTFWRDPNRCLTLQDLPTFKDWQASLRTMFKRNKE